MTAATYRGDFDNGENEFYEQQTSQYGYESDQSAPDEEEALEFDGDYEDIEATKINESTESIGLGQGKIGRNKKAKGKPGSKAKLADKFTDDLVDIICNNDVYKKRIIFTSI